MPAFTKANNRAYFHPIRPPLSWTPRGKVNYSLPKEVVSCKAGSNHTIRMRALSAPRGWSISPYFTFLPSFPIILHALVAYLSVILFTRALSDHLVTPLLLLHVPKLTPIILQLPTLSLVALCFGLLPLLPLNALLKNLATSHISTTTYSLHYPSHVAYQQRTGLHPFLMCCVKCLVIIGTLETRNNNYVEIF